MSSISIPSYKVYNLSFKTLVVSSDRECGWRTQIVSFGNQSALPSRCIAKMLNESKALKIPSSLKCLGSLLYNPQKGLRMRLFSKVET
ncbi:hypothetical protein ACET3X_001233 [Alternaria dauci]|uniref:Uncharacterized protein n=1 Tax=Alternaria dauci TaxID=48095 RepID=A0ABR3UWP3_9PLEO